MPLMLNFLRHFLEKRTQGAIILPAHHHSFFSKSSDAGVAFVHFPDADCGRRGSFQCVEGHVLSGLTVFLDALGLRGGCCAIGTWPRSVVDDDN